MHSFLFDWPFLLLPGKDPHNPVAGVVSSRSKFLLFRCQQYSEVTLQGGANSNQTQIAKYQVNTSDQHVSQSLATLF